MTVGKFVAAVLVSAGRHPFTGTPRACRGDAVALALGQRIVGDALRIIHAGAIHEPALNDYLALGAGTIEVVTTPHGEDHGLEVRAGSRPIDRRFPVRKGCVDLAARDPLRRFTVAFRLADLSA